VSCVKIATWKCRLGKLNVMDAYWNLHKKKQRTQPICARFAILNNCIDILIKLATNARLGNRLNKICSVVVVEIWPEDTTKKSATVVRHWQAVLNATKLYTIKEINFAAIACINNQEILNLKW
jgi:hypothetical protein